MKAARILLALILYIACCAASAQEHQEFSLPEESEDSLSSLAIMPIEKPNNLLKLVTNRLEMDKQQKHKSRRYQIDATFNQEYLLPFSASLIFTAETGIGLNNIKEERFCYEGTYKLEHEDSVSIIQHLIQFATLSPIHAHKAYWDCYTANSPLLNAKKTFRSYDVTADSIADAKGRSVLRFHFVWKEKQDQSFNWDRYHGHIAGTAYFDGHSLRMTQFNGTAHLPSLKYITSLRYRIEYDRRENKPVVKRILIDGTKGDMTMRATLHELR